MRRVQLIELADQAWCPPSVRDALTDYLQFSLLVTRSYHPALPRLRRALVETDAVQVVDLCSGGGGPWPLLHAELAAAVGRPLDLCLTDWRPNIPAFRRIHRASGGMIAFRGEQVDAGAVPDDLRGFRTMFSCLHHFPPREARRIVADAVRRGEGIGVFEATERSRRALLLMLLIPLIVLLTTPFIRPFRLDRLFWTYLVPLVPLIACFDGVVSCLRTYTPAELRQLVAGLGDETYHWEIGQEHAPRTPVPITYLIGYPTKHRS